MKQEVAKFDFVRKAIFLHPPAKPFPPLTAHVNIGHRCNLHCIYCWHRDPEFPAFVPSQEDPGYDLNKLIDHLAEIGTRTIEIAGSGEPLIFKNILQILTHIKKAGLQGHLFTNGTTINDHTMDELIKMRWDFINFSFDAHNQEVFSRLKEPKKELFSELASNVKKLAHKKKTKLSNYPDIRLSYIVTKFNFNFIDEFIDLAISLSVNSVYFPRLQQFSFNEDLRPSDEEEKIAMRTINKNIEKLKKYKILASSYFKNQNWPHRKFCLVPWLAPFITNDGIVHACCRIQEEMGDLNKNTLEEIWKGQKYDRIREMIREGNWLNTCKDCHLDIS